MTLPVDQIICAEAKAVMSGFPADSIDLIMTSPPYWGLRDYGIEGQLGLESHPQEYLEKLWEIFDECKRVLKPTGCCFVNMGDTYFSGVLGETRNMNRNSTKGGYANVITDESVRKVDGGGAWLKPKNLLMIPERFVIGMQERGWWLRNKIVWSKPNAMPSSVKDRFSCTWEYVYFFTKSARYWFDLDAVRDAMSPGSDFRGKGDGLTPTAQATGNENLGRGSRGDPALGKNPGDCWRIPTCAFPESHFAVFPPALIRKPIRAGCPAKVCVECGKPWERQVEVVRQVNGETTRHLQSGARRHREAEPQERPPYSQGTIADSSDRRSRPLETVFAESIGQERKTIGWQPTCECGAETEPGITYDPFVGSGTTCIVAKEEGRHYAGSDLSEEYCEMARKRLAQVQAPLFAGD